MLHYFCSNVKKIDIADRINGVSKECNFRTVVLVNSLSTLSMASNSFILPSNVHRTPVSLTVLWNVYGDCDNYATLKGHSGAVMELHYNTDGR